MGRGPKRKLDLSAELLSIEEQRQDARIAKQSSLLCRPGRAVNGNGLTFRHREGPARISGSEDEEMCRHAGIPWSVGLPGDMCASAAKAHSPATSGSVSCPRCCRASAAKAAEAIRRDNAQAAAPRTSGEGSSARLRQGGISDRSPELPAAMSTLRMKRSRPIRLTGEPENRLRKAASSSSSKSARAGCKRSSRAASFASEADCANLFQGQTARQSSQP